jgi:hypothetical protein
MPRVLEIWKPSTPADKKFSKKRIAVFLIIGFASFFLLINADFPQTHIWGGLLAHSVFMIFDALIVLSGKAPLGEPHFGYFILACHSPILTTSVLIFDIVALIIVVEGIFKLFN